MSESEAEREITLAESIALALEHNTGLRIAALNPIAATNQVRKAYSQFDPELFGNTSKQRSQHAGRPSARSPTIRTREPTTLGPQPVHQ